MVSAPLVSHFVRDVIDRKRIAYMDFDCPVTPIALLPPAQGTPRLGDAAATRAENVADVIVGRPDHGIARALVLTKHG